MENKEYQAGATLINEGIDFTIPGIFSKKTFSIKPLKPGTIVKISQYIATLEPISEDDMAVQELLTKGKNLNVIADVIATAIINREITQRWKFRYYRWLLLNKVENLQYLYSYLLLVYRQMSAEHFFFIMALTPAMNYLKKRESKEEVKRSGGQSPSFKKPSA
jgi:hypothetical protein